MTSFCYNCQNPQFAILLRILGLLLSKPQRNWQIWIKNENEMNSGSRSQMLSSGKWPIDATARLLSPVFLCFRTCSRPLCLTLERLRFTFMPICTTWPSFSLFYYFHSKINSFSPVLFIRNVLDSFICLFSFLRNSQLKSDVRRLP